MDAHLVGERTGPRWPQLTAVLVGLSVLGVVFAILISPDTLLGKADLMGYAVCHQIPERSFVVAGQRFPLCARCTGTFLGIVLGLGWIALLRRSRTSRLPPASVLAVLIVFVGLWAFDGLNSYLTLIPGAPYLYQPRNWLRFTTGLLNGLALITLVLPIYSFTLWRSTQPQPVIRNVKEIAVLLPVVAILVVATQSGVDLVLYPLAILSSAGVIVVLTMINAMPVAVILGRDGYARTWGQVLVPLSIGAGLALLEIAALDLMRAYLTAVLALPI